MVLSHIDVFLPLSLSLPSPLSKSISMFWGEDFLKSNHTKLELSFSLSAEKDYRSATDTVILF